MRTVTTVARRVQAFAAIAATVAAVAATAAAVGSQGGDALPAGFVHLGEAIPGIVVDVRYYGAANFVGAPVDGYEAPVAILTQAAADALRQVQATLRGRGFGLKVFDAYRPQTAVDHFSPLGLGPGRRTHQGGVLPGGAEVGTVRARLHRGAVGPLARQHRGPDRRSAVGRRRAGHGDAV